jgi:hypothetical protein
MCPRKLLKDKSDFSNYLLMVSDFLLTVSKYLLSVSNFLLTVSNFLLSKSLLDDGKCKFRAMFMADKFIEQNDIKTMQNLSGIGVNDILDLINKLL